VPVLLHQPEHESSSYRFCTNFAVTGQGLDAGSFVPSLEALGDSELVVGDDQTLRVHLHTDEPERAMAVFADVGTASHVDVADMHEQVADRSARLAPDGSALETTACAVVAVASGSGLTRLFEELGVLVVDGGATMNPSTHELLAGIHAAAGREVLVLPNSANVRLAAERAAELSEKPARVVPTTAPQEGLAALLAFVPSADAETNHAAVSEAAEALSVGGVAEAARDDGQGRFHTGDAVGYAGGELVAWGDPAATLAATIERIGAGSELITCIAGADAPLSRDDLQERIPNGLELEYHEGGQPAWWWLLCAE
jgi:dihydroxyacetone kinase-like predicted kinase